MDDRGFRKRAARIDVNCAAVLVEPDGCRVDVVIVDVSSTGFRLRSDAELLAGDDVVLELPKSLPVRAKIQWVRGLEAGGLFLDAVSL